MKDIYKRKKLNRSHTHIYAYGVEHRWKNWIFFSFYILIQTDNQRWTSANRKWKWFEYTKCVQALFFQLFNLNIIFNFNSLTYFFPFFFLCSPFPVTKCFNFFPSHQKNMIMNVHFYCCISSRIYFFFACLSQFSLDDFIFVFYFFFFSFFFLYNWKKFFFPRLHLIFLFSVNKFIFFLFCSVSFFNMETNANVIIFCFQPS